MVVGRRGAVDLVRGWYGYVGSALGPGGLAARVGRHLRPVARRHWHFDYLKQGLAVRGVWWLAAPDRQECHWTQALLALPGLARSVAGLGASDCDCKAHFLRFTRRPDKGQLRLALASGSSRGVQVQCWTPAGPVGRATSEGMGVDQGSAA